MSYWFVVAGLACFKVLLLPSYRSTDFEVHRNWLAITHTLPVDKWYYDTTSPWTLDYPPLFAWFECFLSQFACLFDPKMLIVQNLDYASDRTILFQKLTVIIGDLVWAYGCKLCCSCLSLPSETKMRLSVFIIMFGNAGLLLVDHIHFQYNGLLYGILFISIARIIQGRELEGAFWFSILINMKHIYLYIAPAYFIYLLRSYCFSSTVNLKIKWLSLSISRLFGLAIIVISVFAVSFGPFIAKGQLHQVIGRLFPFKRGLCHAYWAPNFWSLYNFADKLLIIIGKHIGWLDNVSTASMTGGLVQEFDHVILPSVPPIATLTATLLSIMPCLVTLWNRPHDPWMFVRAIVMCGFGSFIFGWHVHEKAALLIILPMSLLCLKREASIFIFMSIVTHFSLFPLILTNHETPIKVLLLLIHAAYTWRVQEYSNPNNKFNKPYKLQWWMKGPASFEWTSLYMFGLVLVFLYGEVFHKLIGLEENLPFLPLMLTSVYCALGMFISWINYHICISNMPVAMSRENITFYPKDD